MKHLLDENLSEELQASFKSSQAFRVKNMGWKGIGNGELLRLAREHGFSSIVTADRLMEHQQNWSASGLCLIVFDAYPNTLANQILCAASLEERLAEIKPGNILTVPGPHPKRS